MKSFELVDEYVCKITEHAKMEYPETYHAFTCGYLQGKLSIILTRLEMHHPEIYLEIKKEFELKKNIVL